MYLNIRNTDKYRKINEINCIYDSYRNQNFYKKYDLKCKFSTLEPKKRNNYIMDN